jgi:hypothetical protein
VFTLRLSVSIPVIPFFVPGLAVGKACFRWDWIVAQNVLFIRLLTKSPLPKSVRPAEPFGVLLGVLD